MAMLLELGQYRVCHPASAVQPLGSSFPHGVSSASVWLPPLRNTHARRPVKIGQKSLHYLHLNSQNSVFIKANSSFLLCPSIGIVDTSGGSATTCVARASSARNSWERGGSPTKPSQGGLLPFLVGLIKTAFRLASIIIILSTMFAATAPAILSWPRGLKTVVSLANHIIPGTLSVAHASLGWKKPVLVEGVTLKSVDGQTVVSIPKVESRASLWSIVSGKTGFGDTVVTAPMMDLQQDSTSGQPHLALALTPLEKLRANNPNANKESKHSKQPVLQPATDVAVTATVKAPRGGLEVVDGKLVLPRDAATAIGPSIFVDVAVGRFATEDNDALAEADAEKSKGSVSVRVNVYSDRAQAEGLGFLSLKRGQVELLRPLKAEMDLTPALGKLYLAQLNPLLGEVVGPGIGEEDLPDVTLYVAPSGFVLPSDEYSIRIEPMRTTLAKGQLVEGVLNLLSKQDLSKGRSQVTAQTSAIEASINLKTGLLTCSRLDLLIADRVHVATWGDVDTICESVEMTLAIPGSTLRDTLGISRFPPGYHLKIPIHGTFEQPQVDWMAAGKGLAQLTLRQQKGGELFSSIFQQFEKEADSSEVPKPIEALPWGMRK